MENLMAQTVTLYDNLMKKIEDPQLINSVFISREPFSDDYKEVDVQKFLDLLKRIKINARNTGVHPDFNQSIYIYLKDSRIVTIREEYWTILSFPVTVLSFPVNNISEIENIEITDLFNHRYRRSSFLQIDDVVMCDWNFDWGEEWTI